MKGKIELEAAVSYVMSVEQWNFKRSLAGKASGEASDFFPLRPRLSLADRSVFVYPIKNGCCSPLEPACCSIVVLSYLSIRLGKLDQRVRKERCSSLPATTLYAILDDYTGLKKRMNRVEIAGLKWSLQCSYPRFNRASAICLSSLDLPSVARWNLRLLRTSC